MNQVKKRMQKYKYQIKKIVHKLKGLKKLIIITKINKINQVINKIKLFLLKDKRNSIAIFN